VGGFRNGSPCGAMAAKQPIPATGGVGGSDVDAGGSADLEFWGRKELEALCRCPDVLLRCFSRRSIGATSAECAGLAGCGNLARIIAANHSAMKWKI
jgi:hypothetical protein